MNEDYFFIKTECSSKIFLEISVSYIYYLFHFRKSILEISLDSCVSQLPHFGEKKMLENSRLVHGNLRYI